MSKRFTILILAALLCRSGWAQLPIPADPYPGKVLIQYATVHIGNGEVLNSGIVEIQNGEISRVSDASRNRVNLSDYDTVINADGAHLYPGFIVMDSRLGLTEIGAVRATHDYDETGEFLPNIRSIAAFNTESKIIPTVRFNGVLMAQIAPKGGRISGSSSMVHFDGWDWQDAAIRMDEGVFLNWPSRYRHTGWWAEPGPMKPNKKYNKEVERIHDFFSLADAYQKDGTPLKKNLRFESMKGIFNDSARLYIRANSVKDILDVVSFIRSQGIKKVSLVGAHEASLVMNELKENNISVIIDRVHRLPEHPDTPIDLPFRIAAELVEAEIDVAFATSGDMEAMISRNLPFQVGTAVHYGLEYEQAIRSLTLVPAQLAGVEDDYGSIEPGKRATLFLSEGDALDITTNKLRMAMIEGKFIDLENHQTALYKKYAKRYGISTD